MYERDCGLLVGRGDMVSVIAGEISWLHLGVCIKIRRWKREGKKENLSSTSESLLVLLAYLNEVLLCVHTSVGGAWGVRRGYLVVWS